MADYIHPEWQRNYNPYIMRLVQIAVPSRVILLGEENPQLPNPYPPSDKRAAINDAWWLISNYADRPATYHLAAIPGAGKSNVAFVDGHVEMKRWVDSRTLIPITGVGQPPALNVFGSPDYHYVYLRAEKLQPIYSYSDDY